MNLFRARRRLATMVSVVLFSGALGAQSVVINEIHYNPREGEEFSFLELYNPGPEAADLSGWSFSAGIDYAFAGGTSLPPNGYLVLCRNPELLAALTGLPAESLTWWGASSLDNGGETLTLLDGDGHVADEVTYDDGGLWDLEADGGGASLHRECAVDRLNLSNNWRADDPTPLAPRQGTGRTCPPPALPIPTIAINEIYYHPLNDTDADFEFVELINATEAPVDLEGYHFTQGIDFTFSEPTVLEPGETIAVARNAEELRGSFGQFRVVGDFIGQLSNDGERLTLVDAAGAIADSVRYRDSGDWSVAADGFGFSLEKILATAPSDDPRSWRDSGAVDAPQEEGWANAVAQGVATSDTLYFYLKAEGEVLIDNVSVVNLADPDTNLVPNGSFDTGIEGWEPRGTHEGSRWSQSPGGEMFPDAALHMISTGRGSSSNSVRIVLPAELDRDPAVTYRLSFDYFFVRGSTNLLSRFSIATASRGMYVELGGEGGPVATPGQPNIVRRETVAPFVSRVVRFPQEPRSEDPVTINAWVRGEPTEVRLVAELPDGVENFEMKDDGASDDGAAGDEVYGVVLPPQPHDTPVPFTILAIGADSDRSFPAREEQWQSYGYYVNDNQPESKLPVIHFLVPDTNPRNFFARLNCSAYVDIDLAHRGDLFHNVGVRRRGGSVCGDPDVIKKYLKVRFHKGQEFSYNEEWTPHKNLNFQSLWTDKALIRENMAWDVFNEMGQPYCTHDFVRLHANGDYYGLYAAMERPDARWLRRNGLDPNGDLYKATASREEANGTYEKKTNEFEGLQDLREFLTDMHATPRAGLVDFFEEKVHGDGLIDYQAAQIVMNNRDYPHKNHYLYHDRATGKWWPTAWDLDLVYGKRWDGSFEGVLNDAMDNPGINPWYTTNVRGSGGGNHFHDKFFYQAGDYYQRAYLVRLWSVLMERYTTDFYEEKILGLRDLIFEEQEEDIAEWGRSRPSANDRNAPAEFDPNLDRVREHIRIRREYLIRYLEQTERMTPPDRVKITEIMYNPVGADDTEFLEIWNNSERPIDISNWKIEGLEAMNDGGSLEEFRFPPGSQLETDEIIVVAKDPARFRAVYGDVARVFGPYPGVLSNDGEELRIKDVGPGHPATVEFIQYDTEREWPAEADGLGPSMELAEVGVLQDNDLGRYWRPSAEVGGTPGFIEGISPQGDAAFRRADANGDALIDLTDAVFILSYVAGIGVEPSCLAAADTDASDALDLTDGVYLATYLFLEGPLPPAPFQTCAPVGNGAALSCDRFPASACPEGG